jgi:tetratricopeptide (TPR) repeat protein
MRTTTALFVALIASATAPFSLATQCNTAIGRIDGIVINGGAVEEAPANVVTLSRGNDSIPVKNGLPVCARDLISTAQSASVTVRLGESAERENQITIYGGSTTELLAPDSLFLKIGRLFASLRAPFSANTVFGSLAARGTTFELEASDENATVLQLEGSIDFNPQISRLSPIPRIEVAMGRLVPASFFYQAKQVPKSQAKAVPKCATGPATQMQREGDVGVPRLTRLTFGRQQPPRTQGLDVQICESLVRKNNADIIATRPKIPSRPVTTDVEGKASLYENARLQAVCAARAEGLRDLAAAYTAWNQAADAVHALEKARQVKTPGASDPIALNDIGNAYRLAGDLKTATQFYNAALKQDSRFAFPYNGLGDVSRDSALIAYAHSNADQAKTYLEEAKRYYQRSLGGEVWGKEQGNNRAIALYNLGDTNLLLAILQPDGADSLLKEADDLFHQAFGQSNFPFAQVGLARVQLTRAQLVRTRQVAEGGKFWDALGQSIGESMRLRQERKPFLDQAEQQLKSALQRYPRFSAATEMLGEVLEERGNRREAAKQFQQAIELDPHNSIAYLRYSRTLRRGDAQVYAQLSRQIDPPAVAEINLGRTKISQPPPPASGETIAPAPPNPNPQGDQAASQGSVVLSATSLQFSYLNRPDTKTVAVTNSGPGRLTIQSVSLEGNARAFRITNDGCTHRKLDANRRCSLQVGFVGSGEGSRSVATLVIVHDGSNSPQRVELSGEYPVQ